MNRSNLQLQQRIHAYFNQLTQGCGNFQCSNINCFSSKQFQHKGISNNQAAIIALQLLQNDDDLCIPPDNSTLSETSAAIDFPRMDRSSSDSPELVTDYLHHSTNITTSYTDDNSLNQPVTPRTVSSSLSSSYSNRVRISESTLDPSRISIVSDTLQPSSSRTNSTLITHENSFSSMPHSLRRFLLQMSNLTRSPNDEDDVTNALLEFADVPNLAEYISSTSTDDFRSTNTETPNTDSSSVDKQTLQDILERFTKVDSSQIQEKTSVGRVQGLTLDELNRCIADGHVARNWLPLQTLINDVFSSIPALASSFPSIAPLSIPSSPVAEDENLIFNADGDFLKKHQRLAATTDIDMDIEPTFDSASDALPNPNDISRMDAASNTNAQKHAPEKSIRSLKYGPKAVPVNIADVQKAYKNLLSLPEEANIIRTLSETISRFVYSKLRITLFSNPPASLLLEKPQPYSQDDDMQQRTVNIFIILYACPLVWDPLYFENILPILCRASTWLPMPIQARICRTWADHEKAAASFSQDQPVFVEGHLVDLQKIFMQQITLRCLTLNPDTSPNEDKQIREAARVLRIIFYSSLLAGTLDPEEQLLREAIENKEVETILPSQTARRNPKKQPRHDPLSSFLGISPHDCRTPLIPTSEFINETLNDNIDAEKDFLCFHSRSPLDKLSFMELPFLLQTTKKSTQLFCDNRLRMLEERRSAFLQSLLYNDPELPFFKLRVARERVVEDALVVLELAWMESPADLKKQLFVEFDGEQGIDEGGLSKEFFQLIIQRIFNSDYGMFIFDDVTQTFWFNPSPMEDLYKEYCLIGTILGLAIYNHIILDIHFPSVLYRKLLGKLGTFEDLKEGWPALAHGLQEMLIYEEDNFEDVFCANFVISQKDMFGNIVHQDLVPGGSSMVVTKENRKEFVDLSADYLLNTSIKSQFSAFRRGFNLVIDESPLSFLFSAKEIELLVIGSQDYNFSELERVAEYEGDYSSESPVIKNFWSVVHNLPAEKQRQLLQFTTGSDRIPLGGMSKLKFIIARQGPDSDRLPTAHTCFNILLLPEYSSIEKLERCLCIAITHFKGFGMF